MNKIIHEVPISFNEHLNDVKLGKRNDAIDSALTVNIMVAAPSNNITDSYCDHNYSVKSFYCKEKTLTVVVYYILDTFTIIVPWI